MDNAQLVLQGLIDTNIRIEEMDRDLNQHLSQMQMRNTTLKLLWT